MKFGWYWTSITQIFTQRFILRTIWYFTKTFLLVYQRQGFTSTSIMKRRTKYKQWWGTCRDNAAFSTRLLASGTTPAILAFTLRIAMGLRPVDRMLKKCKCLCSKDDSKDPNRIPSPRLSSNHQTQKDATCDKHKVRATNTKTTSKILFQCGH